MPCGTPGDFRHRLLEERGQFARSGEGATKLISVEVCRAKNEAQAKRVAKSVVNSPLVKTAWAGADPNWGRIVSAAGMAGAPFDPDKCLLKLQRATVFRRGRPLPFDKIAVSRSLDAEDVRIRLACNLGSASATCWTCDLSRDYITINADYHT